MFYRNEQQQQYLDVPVATYHEEKPQEATIFGLRKRIFWPIVLGIAVVIIVAAIGGGVGAHVANNNESSPVANLSPGSSTTISSVQDMSSTPAAPTAPATSASSASLPPAIDGTGLTLAAWRSSSNTSDLNLWLFYQGKSSELRERIWTLDSGWSSNSSRITESIVSRNNTPLSQINLATANGSRSIRLFYLNDENIICDVAYSNGQWSKGDLEGGGFTAAEDSKLAILPWSNGTELQVYYQDSSNDVRELRWRNNVWARSNQLLTTAKGSGLAVLYSTEDGDPQVRLYAQTADHAIVSMDYKLGSWYLPYALYNSTVTPLGTNIAATIVNTGAEYEGLLLVRVYFLGEGGIVRVMTWQGGWSNEPRNLVEGVEGGALAAVDWDVNNGRTYFQRKSGTLGEMVVEGKSLNASDFSI